MVSVITISNSRRELLKTIYGVINSIEKSQKIKEAEYIIVEVKTTHEKLEIKDSKKIKINHIEVEKGGFSLQRNVGIKSAKGDIIIFIDDGMDVPPTWSDEIVSPLISGEADAVMGAVIPKIEKTKDILSHMRNILSLSQSVLGFPAGGLKIFRKGKTYIDSFSTSNLSIWKKLIADVGMFDEKLIFGAEDSDISLRIKQKFTQSRFLYNPSAYVFAEPRKSLKEIKKWFIRRGKSFALFTKKHEGKSVKNIFKRELLFPKLILSSVNPLSFSVFIALYIRQAENILNQASQNHFFPKEYKKIMKFVIPFVKFYMDFYYSIGYYSEIFKSQGLYY